MSKDQPDSERPSDERARADAPDALAETAVPPDPTPSGPAPAGSAPAGSAPAGSVPAEIDPLARTHTSAGSLSRAGEATGASFEVGSVLGRYTILGVLGQGGMGVVYAARDPDLDRKVALKLLRGSTAASEQARARLLREARAMARLSHVNVITVYEVGTVGGHDFIAMELIEGPDDATSIDRWLRGGRDWREVLEVFVQAGRGLVAAHEQGMVHRDFKPHNVLMRADGRVCVTDFGLATEIGAEGGTAVALPITADTPSLTRTGALVGTPAYMAPEQLAGRPADQRSDQFSFCASLYEALYGQRPFVGETVDELVRARQNGLPAEPDGARVPGWLRKVLARGLACEPAERYPSMHELLADIERGARRRRPRVLVAGMLAIAVVAGVALLAIGPSAAAAPESCRGDGLVGAWDAPSRQRVDTALRAAGDTGPAVASVERAMDSFASAWRAERASACATPDGASFHAEMACLMEQRAEVATVVDVLASLDADSLAQVGAVVGRLPEPAACTDPDALSIRPRAPADPAVLVRVEAVRRSLAEADALQRALRLEQALEVAENALSTARELDHPPVVAEALVRVGEVYTLKEEPDEARTALGEAALLAEEVGHERARADALVGLAEVEVAYSSDREKAATLARRAGVAVRKTKDARLRARLDAIEGHLAFFAGEPDKAQQLLERALAHYAAPTGGDLFEAASLWSMLTMVHMRAGENDKALEVARDALARLREGAGADHPNTARLSEIVAHLLRASGDYDGARELFLGNTAFWQSPRGREYLRASGNDALQARDGGRTVRGTVVDADGRPVGAGMRVVVSQNISGDGKYLIGGMGGELELVFGTRYGVTDAQGRFVIDGVRRGIMFAAAESDDGRSHSAALPEEGDATLKLVVRPYGALRGRLEATRAADLALPVSAAPSGSHGMTLSVVPDAEGAYAFDRLAEGRYTLIVGHTDVVAAAEAVVVAGEAREAAPIVVERGDIAVRIAVRGEREIPIDEAQVFVFVGDVRFANGRELERSFYELARRGPVRMDFVAELGNEVGPADSAVSFTRVKPGRYTACAIPISGDMRDPRLRRRIQLHRFDLEIHCQPIRVAPEPAEQRFVLEVPPMRRLPTAIERR